MRRVTGWIALAALALLGGCAHPAPPQGAAAVPRRGQPVALRSPAVACSTTYLVLATVSQCGEGGLRFGVAAE